jgi:ferredoxin/nitrate reductase gamma subunit
VRRETFLTLQGWEVVLFYALVPIVVLILGYGVAALALKYRRGRGETRLDDVVGGARRAAAELLTHQRIGRGNRMVGLGHLGIFYGFVALSVATLILFVNDDIVRPLMGIDLWRDAFYLAYSFLADVFGLALVAGLVVMSVRRLHRPAHLDYTRPAGLPVTFDRRLYRIGDWAFLGSLIFLGVSGFIIEACRIAVDGRSYEVWSIVGWPLAQGIRALGVTGPGPTIDSFRHVLWWAHAGVALVAVAAIPYTKAVHMLVAPATLVVRDRAAGKRLAPVPSTAAADDVGYGRLVDSPRSISRSSTLARSADAVMLPAPRSRRAVPSRLATVLDLRESAEGALGIRARAGLALLHDASQMVLGDPIRSATLWACTHCLACVDACPVGIEHVPVINQLRRRLVELGELDDALRKTLGECRDDRQLGQPRRKRGSWARISIARSRMPRSNRATCSGSSATSRRLIHERTMRALALARLFQIADVDVGLLYEAERSAGCDVRRVGEEGLWRTLAESNVATLGAAQFERVVTSDRTPCTRFETSIRTRRLVAGAPSPEVLADLLRNRRLVASRRLPYARPTTTHASSVATTDLRAAAPSPARPRPQCHRDAAKPARIVLVAPAAG